jgi:hypothetical protein
MISLLSLSTMSARVGTMVRGHRGRRPESINFPIIFPVSGVTNKQNQALSLSIGGSGDNHWRQFPGVYG